MATVRMFGQQFAVDLIRKLGQTARGEDQWEAKALAHTARTFPGTTIKVLQSEVIEAAAAEMPPEASAGDLAKAMADERAALDAAGLSAANLIEKYRATLKDAGKLGGGNQ